MESSTEYYSFSNQLSFFGDLESPLTVSRVELAIAGWDENTTRCHLTFQVTPERYRRIGEFVCRANFGMIIGNFELDFNTGEIRYKTSIDINDSFLTEETLKQLVYTNVLTMDQYLPGIDAVISSKTSPEEAIR